MVHSTSENGDNPFWTENPVHGRNPDSRRLFDFQPLKKVVRDYNDLYFGPEIIVVKLVVHIYK